MVAPTSPNWLDETFKSLYERVRRLKQPESDSVEYTVLAAIACVPRWMQLVGRMKVEIQGGAQSVMQIPAVGAKPIDISMPPGQFETRFSEPERSIGFWRLYLSSKRIRSHVSYHCGIGVPMAYVFLGPGLLFPFKQFGDLDRFMAYHGPGEPDQVNAWREDVSKRYAEARRTLTELTPDNDVDRAICLVGEGLVQEDVEESFSCFWRAIERIAKFDLRKARAAVQAGSGDSAVEYARLLLPGLINSQPVTLDTGTAAEISVRKRVPNYSGVPVSELYSLRTAIIHDNPTPDQVMKIARSRDDLVGLAFSIVNSALTEHREGA